MDNNVFSCLSFSLVMGLYFCVKERFHVITVIALPLSLLLLLHRSLYTNNKNETMKSLIHLTLTGMERVSFFGYFIILSFTAAYTKKKSIWIGSFKCFLKDFSFAKMTINGLRLGSLKMIILIKTQYKIFLQIQRAKICDPHKMSLKK